MSRFSTISFLYSLRDIQKKRHVITSIPELDRYFTEVDACMRESSDAGLAALARIRYQPMHSPYEPFSAEYAQAQMDLYLQISGRNRYVASEAEKSVYDFEQLKDCPYPFFTKSSEQVWDQYVGIGHLIRVLSPSPGSEILEFGSGWGNVALPLAQMGNKVTCVEIDDLMVKMLHYRAAQMHQSIAVVQADMLAFATTKQFDAIIFYEAFHHCLDHVRMLERLKSWLKPGGKLIFAGEPIALFPYPWGVRLDGLSLWSMRKYGWYELGFSRPYFQALLRSKGWTFKRHKLRGIHIADAYVAQLP